MSVCPAVDYILIARKDVKLNMNLNEVEATRWVPRAELRDLFARREATGELITPWFEMIVNALLNGYWDNLESVLKGEVPDDGLIHRLKL